MNLYQLEIDRDRAAVVHKFDIDTRVSDIWAKAILRNKELIPLYYKMLKVETSPPLSECRMIT